MREAGPFHEGERLVQRKAHEDDVAEQNGTMISNRIMGGALPFLRQQRMALIGTQDDEGRLWASALFGPAGFVQADARSLTIDLASAPDQAGPELWKDIESHPKVGLLFIELSSRRRFRVNGQAQRESPARLRVDVAEAYPNCPKYIQRREMRPGEAAGDHVVAGAAAGQSLSQSQMSLIAAADTMFVSSRHPERGADVSHRGGRPGFVEVVNDRTLRIPDYPGNGMFNTLGNLAVYPKAGLLFVDFVNERSLQLTGLARILWDRTDEWEATGGTGRWWELTVQEWRERPLQGGMQWEFLDASRYNP